MSIYPNPTSNPNPNPTTNPNPRSAGIVVSVGGQIPNNLALPLHQQGARILGTSPDRLVLTYALVDEYLRTFSRLGLRIISAPPINKFYFFDSFFILLYLFFNLLSLYLSHKLALIRRKIGISSVLF
jgi:hypothetical protein